MQELVGVWKKCAMQRVDRPPHPSPAPYRFQRPPTGSEVTAARTRSRAQVRLSSRKVIRARAGSGAPLHLLLPRHQPHGEQLGPATPAPSPSRSARHGRCSRFLRLQRASGGAQACAPARAHGPACDASPSATALRSQTAQSALPSFQTGGIAWFTDLSVADPYYALPALSAATFLLTVEARAPAWNPRRARLLPEALRVR